MVYPTAARSHLEVRCGLFGDPLCDAFDRWEGPNWGWLLMTGHDFQPIIDIIARSVADSQTAGLAYVARGDLCMTLSSEGIASLILSTGRLPNSWIGSRTHV